MAHAVHNSSLSWRRKEESVVFSASTYQPAVLFSFFLLTKLCLYRLPFAFCAFSQMKPPPPQQSRAVSTRKACLESLQRRTKPIQEARGALQTENIKSHSVKPKLLYFTKA